MLVKNLKTGVVWAVSEKHGAALLRSGDFEETEAPKKRAPAKKPETDEK